MLKLIQSYFGVGKIHKHGETFLQFRIRSVKELPVLINLIEKYPLISQKFADYKLFKEVFNLILQR